MTKTELDRAYLRGIAAAQVGVKPTANPFKHRSGRDGDLLRESWDAGHAEYAKQRGIQAHGVD